MIAQTLPRQHSAAAEISKVYRFAGLIKGEGTSKYGAMMLSWLPIDFLTVCSILDSMRGKGGVTTA